MWPFDPPYPTLKRVIINTLSDRAFRGLLWRKVNGYLVLREVELLKAKGEVTPMDGEVLIESANVDFMQVI